MNIRNIKRKMIVEGAIVAIAIVVLSSGSYYLSSLLEDYERMNNGINGELSQIAAEKNTLEGKYSKTKENYALYQEILKRRSSSELDIDRDLIHVKFNDFQSRYFLSNMRLTMTNPQELTGNNYKRVSGTVIASEVSVEFDALSDEDVYDFIQAIQEELSGVVKITSFAIHRDALVSNDVLRQIAEKGAYKLVGSSLKFTWYGLKITEQPIVNPL